MKLEKLQPGQIVFDVHSYRMGNTTMRTMGCWSVRIVAVDLERGTVRASWNHNDITTYYQRSWSKWREKKPLMMPVGSYGKRLATREEIKAHKAKEQQP